MGAFPETTHEYGASIHAAMALCDSPRVAISCHHGFDALAALVHAAHQWTAEGGAALVVTSDSTARHRADGLLALPQTPAGANAIAIVEATPLAAKLVEAWGAVAKCPRSGRLLDGNEMDVLMEDMKVSGLKTGRLKEMFKFFRKSISDGENRNEFWLVTPEEQKVYAILEENLEARQAMMPCEAAGLALRCITAEDSPLATAGATAVLAPLFPAFAHKPVRLFVDDFGALNRCAQELCLALANDGLVASGCSSPGCAADEPYPYPEGFQELVANATTILEADGPIAAVQPSRTFTTPSQEFNGAAETVAKLLEDGLSPNDILIAVPNGIWSDHITHALEARGISAVKDFGPAKIKGDPRHIGQSSALRRAALTKLARSGGDHTALRTWLGLGDWLLASDAFLELMAWGRDHQMNAFDALPYLRNHPEETTDMKLFGKLERALDALDSELAQLRRERGESGLTHVPAPTSSTNRPAVTIAPYGRCRNQRPRVVVATGLVDGFLPRPDAYSDSFTIDHQRKALKREAVLMDDILSCAGEAVIPTLYQQDLMENADALGARITRIVMENETRIARIAPSQLLEA